MSRDGPQSGWQTVLVIIIPLMFTMFGQAYYFGHKIGQLSQQIDSLQQNNDKLASELRGIRTRLRAAEDWLNFSKGKQNNG